jgi:ADP-L-glycero-D-manno-heptose 6-epimerase
MDICVTGASGFIGTNLCFYLEKLGHTVYPVCTSTCLVSDYFRKNTVFQGLFGFDTSVLKYCEGIVHLAANNDTLSEQNSEMLRANFYDSKKLLRLARKNFHKFFIYASSTAVYGQANQIITETTKAKSNTIYSKSKLKFDKFMIKNDPFIKWVGLRLCNVYGPHEKQKGRRASYLGQMLNNMLENKPVKLFEDGTQIRDWCYVEDVCQAFLKAIHSKYTGIYNIGSGKSVTFNELFDTLSEITGYKQKPLWIPNKIAKQYQSLVNLDIEKAQQVLGYEPEYDIDSGIKSYYSWKKNNLDI